MESNTHKKNVASYFSHSAHYWENIYEYGNSAQPFSNYAKNRRKNLVFHYLDAFACKRPLTVLDIGCGPGVFMEESLRRGHTVTGIDLSEEMVRKAHERLDKYGRGSFECRQGDLENIPLGSETVDVVMCLGVLPYLRDDHKAVDEIDRVLKKGGLVIGILPNLIKLGSLVDPYYYLVRTRQYIRYRLSGRDASNHRTLDPVSFNENEEFGVRRYTLKQAVKLFSIYGKIHDENMAAIEYGPPTFWKREILSNDMSIALSRFLARRSSRWVWLKFFANEWVMSITKPS